jgi:hypothetical protein
MRSSLRLLNSSGGSFGSRMLFKNIVCGEYQVIDDTDIITAAIGEAQRLSYLSEGEKKLEGIYASSSNLHRLIKSLRSMKKSPQYGLSLHALLRRVADYSRRDSKLFLLIQEVVRTYKVIPENGIPQSFD